MISGLRILGRAYIAIITVNPMGKFVVAVLLDVDTSSEPAPLWDWLARLGCLPKKKILQCVKAFSFFLKADTKNVCTVVVAVVAKR